MTSVIGRIEQISQPRGGYIKCKDFEKILLDDGNILSEENISPSTIGMAVDYLTRFVVCANVKAAFAISLWGAERAEYFGVKGSETVAEKLATGIKGLDDDSIINACKLVTFDIWYRNPKVASMFIDSYKEVKPDKPTIQNIRIMVNRNISIFKEYGPLIGAALTFPPDNANWDDFEKMIDSGKGTFGGYTATVSTGDGDYLTETTIWDLKVSKKDPDKDDTLQILMYWIMSQHSGQSRYKNITHIGILNPRLNAVYLLDVSKIPEATIKIIEEEVICY